MNARLLIFMLLLFGTTQSNNIFAGGGDDHTHASDVVATTPTEQKYSSSEASSDKYELLLRYEHIHPGEPASLILFVSDYASNKPINEAKIKITSQEDPAISFDVHQDGNGTYAIHATFPEGKTYSLAVSIEGQSGVDLLLLQHIDVGIDEPHIHNEGVMAIFHSTNWSVVLIALLLGVGLGLLFRKRNTRMGKTLSSCILIIIGCSIPMQNIVAHGEGGHDAAGSGNNFSNVVPVPKESQFLFDIYTQKVSRGNFTESDHLFGTILPSSQGQANVTATQDGIITKMFAQVGKEVKAGQPLAILEKTMDVGTQINIQNEINTLQAEFEAAKKEMKRLEAISDIAAKRDIDEATSRLQKAESNLALYKSSTGRTISLIAPISGMVGNFNMAVGTSVTAGQTLFTVTDLSTLYVEAQVFDKDAGKIQPDASYTMECVNDQDNHKTSRIKLLSAAQEINATNQSQKVLFEVENKEGDFKIGEFVNIHVFAATPSQQITLPNSAISEINGKPVVFSKESAESFSVRYIQLGENNGQFTSVLKGIEEGERIVINGSYQLKMIYLNQ